VKGSFTRSKSVLWLHLCEKSGLAMFYHMRLPSIIICWICYFERFWFFSDL